VRAATRVLNQAVVVPQRAVTEMQGTHQVAVVGGDDVVQMRVVEPGPQDGSDIVIASGLKPGERVVVEGVQKVRNGAKVAPQSNVASPGAAPVAPAAPEG
jgi:membrane fusion protein (multidrug efflux system)